MTMTMTFLRSGFESCNEHLMVLGGKILVLGPLRDVVGKSSYGSVTGSIYMDGTGLEKVPRRSNISSP
jgi:hypothetical protein